LEQLVQAYNTGLVKELASRDEQQYEKEVNFSIKKLCSYKNI
jgi:hypothetical protein